MGLLENTDVIITADHGEAARRSWHHRPFGYSAHLEEVGVPLVILSPAAPAGLVVESPVSLRDLPATVVDLLGMSAASPFPQAARWRPTGNWQPGKVPLPGLASPAFSERANSIAFETPASPRPPNTLKPCRCRWWLGAIITSATAWAKSCSMI